MSYHSQNGEDFLLELLLGPRPCGRYLEIGCLDGMHFSNTLHFYEAGWRGLCVEAHAAYYPLVKKNRPGDVVVHAAAGPEDRDGRTFYANRLGSLSTLDSSQERRFAAGYGAFFSGFVEQEVAERRLSTLIDQLTPGPIDFASIDVEGYEVQVLEGLDLTRHRPSVFIVESHDRPHEESLRSLLGPAGYHDVCRIGPNIVYVEDRARWEPLRGKEFTCDLLVTGHPLQKDKNFPVQVRLDTSRWDILAEKTICGKKVL